MERRDFIKVSGMAGVALMSSQTSRLFGQPKEHKAIVALVKTSSRADGVGKAIGLLGLNSFSGKDLFIKPNYNSADPPPGSTHNDTLLALINTLRSMNAGPLTIGDRSGMGDTRNVMQEKKIFDLAKEKKIKTVVFDDLPEDGWKPVKLESMHWEQGFALPNIVLQSGGIIQTCCLKTHRFGGHVTLSLKNSVGLAAKRIPGNSYNYMNELHSSPHQRRMIAEINAAYKPDLILLDGVEAFTTGGPEAGKKVNARVMLAGTDRIAIDAVGTALLRHFGTTAEVSKGAIFKQEQIARAVELHLGVEKPEQIELVTADHESKELAKNIQDILYAG